jgi:hypothetical protein
MHAKWNGFMRGLAESHERGWQNGCPPCAPSARALPIAADKEKAHDPDAGDVGETRPQAQGCALGRSERGASASDTDVPGRHQPYLPSLGINDPVPSNERQVNDPLDRSGVCCS